MLYTDPGSGVLLWQILAAGVVGAMFYVRKFLGVFRRLGGSDKTEKLEERKPNLQ